ncbi:MAG: hypothetical protein WCA21_10225 [Terracidiphilus sp.]
MHESSPNALSVNLLTLSFERFRELSTEEKSDCCCEEKVGHLRHLGSGHVKRKTAQERAKYDHGNLRKMKIPVYSCHCSILANFVMNVSS